MAEVKEKDRQKVLEEIIYCWIVQKFIDNEISMIPKLSASPDPTGRVDFWPNQEHKLESVHSAEALEMIRNHVALVIGDRHLDPVDSLVQISKIKLGKLYTASIMYGYFLKRVDERFQLERSMNTLPEGFREEQSSFLEPSVPQSPFWDPGSLILIYAIYHHHHTHLLNLCHHSREAVDYFCALKMKHWAINQTAYLIPML